MLLSSQLKIVGYEVDVNLGCSESERLNAQPVLFNIEICFEQKVMAEETDQIGDSTDYGALVEIIKKTSRSKSFNMIEHLAFSVSQQLKIFLNGSYRGVLSVQVTKTEVPIDNLHGGAEWICKTSL